MACLAFFMWGQPAAVANQGVGYVDAIGHGVARPQGSPRHQELSARSAAKRAAHLQLISKLKRLHGSGITEYARADYRGDVDFGESHGVVPNAFVVRETVSFRPDPHSGRLMIPVARVLVRYCLDRVSPGCRGATRPSVRTASLPAARHLSPPEDYRGARAVPHAPVERAIEPPRRHGGPPPHVIVDLNGTPFLPVTDPVLTDTRGNRVFGGPGHNGSYDVLFADSVAAAREMPGVGARPIVVQALRVHSDNRIVISDAEARRLRNLLGDEDGAPGVTAMMVITRD